MGIHVSILIIVSKQVTEVELCVAVCTYVVDVFCVRESS